MAKAKDLTKAIWKLLEETLGEITYSEARDRLPSMGVPVCEKQKRISPEYGIWDEYEVDYSESGNVDAVAAACGFDEATKNAVLAEQTVRSEWKSESNHFNVTKNNWNKTKASSEPSVSEKPAEAKNTKSRTAIKEKIRAEMTGGGGADTDALVYVEKQGGLKKCKAKLADLQEKAEKLQADIAKKQVRIDKISVETAELKASVDTVAALKKRLAAA